MNPKPYVREMPRASWYLQHRRDSLHMIHEVSSVFIGIYALMLLWGVRALAQGPEAYQAFLDGLSSPLVLLFQWMALAICLVNSWAWLGATPKAMPIQIGESFVPQGIVAGAHYAAWAVVSLLVLYLAGVL
jgi:fumarate reductase subunit C